MPAICMGEDLGKAKSHRITNIQQDEKDNLYTEYITGIFPWICLSICNSNKSRTKYETSNRYRRYIL